MPARLDNVHVTSASSHSSMCFRKSCTRDPRHESRPVEVPARFLGLLYALRIASSGSAMSMCLATGVCVCVCVFESPCHDEHSAIYSSCHAMPLILGDFCYTPRCYMVEPVHPNALVALTTDVGRRQEPTVEAQNSETQ